MMQWMSSRFRGNAVLSLMAALAAAATAVAAATPAGPPDLTVPGAIGAVDRSLTYNLGPTGLRGWIYHKPATHFDGLQGRTTAASRQILVTHVGAASPAEGFLEVDDVILGIGGERFGDDARKGFALAIQDAEREERGGRLRMTVWRAGRVREIEIQLRVLGTYAATAPFECAKSRQILEDACRSLEQEPLEPGIGGAVTGLALLATGKAQYLPRVRELAHAIGPRTLTIPPHMGSWHLGYCTLFLAEYYLLTSDSAVLPAIEQYTLALAKGQGRYGTFGHGLVPPGPDGELHGSVPPYGPVNAAGLVANLALVMGRKCGLQHPVIDQAIERASNFFRYFVDKGAIPYGEHEPWPHHENNGKNAMAAVFFAAQGERTAEARYFAKMCTAAFKDREAGHTGQGFSYLWGVPGANAGGPRAAAGFFREAAWHLDLVRRNDGSFTYDGGEQYGPGRTHDDTYGGRSSYYGLSPTATYVLAYALPRKALIITGKDAHQANWLSDTDVAEAITAGRFDLDRKTRTATELVAALGSWSPVVRSWAAEELAGRPTSASLVPELMALAEGENVRLAQGACETLGRMKHAEALPVFIRLLSHDDRWLRFKAAAALRTMGGDARPVVREMLEVVARTAEPIEPIVWKDPVQLTHGQLATALFKSPLTDALREADREVLYPAVRTIAGNADGMARATLREFFENRLTVEDVYALGPAIFAAVQSSSPADTMFANEIRMGGFRALVKYDFQEGAEAGVILAQTQGGHGSERRTGEIMKELVRYGAAAKGVLPQLRALVDSFNLEAEQGRFPRGELNARRVGAVEQAIAAIEAATDRPTLRSYRSPEPASR
jgi:HEAT repeat protein